MIEWFKQFGRMVTDFDRWWNTTLPQSNGDRVGQFVVAMVVGYALYGIVAWIQTCPWRRFVAFWKEVRNEA